MNVEKTGPNRRQFIQTVGAAASVSTIGALVPAATALSKPRRRSRIGHLSGIDPNAILAEYEERGLADLSDAEIYREVATLISTPGVGLSSFPLHAPLELMARRGLLDFVAPEYRELARIQMVASAACYEANLDPVDEPASPGTFNDMAAAQKALTQRLSAGDPDGVEGVAKAIVTQFGTSALSNILAPGLLTTLTAAAHSHIGLWLWGRHGHTGDIRDTFLLRAALRYLGQDPRGRLSSFDGMRLGGKGALSMTPSEIEYEVRSKLFKVEKGKAYRSGIRPLISGTEEAGFPDTFFGELMSHDLTDAQIDAAFRAILRISAHSMLQDDPGNRKFGWSHCLTLPQAAFGLSSLTRHRQLALAATMVWISAYRCNLSRLDYDPDFQPKKVEVGLEEALHESADIAAARFWHASPDEWDEARRHLATHASIRNDQHLNKYVRACFDMQALDPMASHVYLAGAATLCGLWIDEVSEDIIEEHLLQGRT